MSQTDRVFVRLSILQSIVAVASILIAGVALHAALNEADAVRKQQQAMVWPDVTFGPFVNAHVAEDGTTVVQVTLTARNNGIGPARIRTARVAVDGTAQPDWAAVLGKFYDGPDLIYTYEGFQRTLLPGESLEFLQLVETNQARAFAREALRGERLEVEACYCSVFDDCWTTRLNLGAVAERTEVKTCPDYGDEQFEV